MSRNKAFLLGFAAGFLFAVGVCLSVVPLMGAA